MTDDGFLEVLAELYPDQKWPKPLHLLQGYVEVRQGSEVVEAARRVGTTRARLQQVVDAADPFLEVLGLGPRDVTEIGLARARQGLGQLLVGRCAELAFEDFYEREMHTQEFELRDLRESHSTTDYRLYNGSGRPLYRLNIKFHGSQFRRAKELVNLEPTDCFALATYKIHSALKAQEEEHLPYIFVIVGVPDLTGETVGARFLGRFVQAVATLVQGKKGLPTRTLEDRAVDFAVEKELPAFRDTVAQLEEVPWYIMSARRADRLLKEKLFERVFALRIRSFAQQFRFAELDMHYSLADDLIPLPRFLATLKDEGLTKVASMLERGDY